MNNVQSRNINSVWITDLISDKTQKFNLSDKIVRSVFCQHRKSSTVNKTIVSQLNQTIYKGRNNKLNNHVKLAQVFEAFHEKTKNTDKKKINKYYTLIDWNIDRYESSDIDYYQDRYKLLLYFLSEPFFASQTMSE